MEDVTKERVVIGQTIVPPAVAERMGGEVTPGGPAGTNQDALRKLSAELSADSEGYVPARALQALDSGDAATALGLCDSFNAMAPSATPLSVLLIRGRALLALRRVDEAAEEFHRILRLEPESPAALKGLGDTYFAQDKEVIAFTYYERACELSGDWRELAEPVRFSVPELEPDPQSDPEQKPVPEAVATAPEKASVEAADASAEVAPVAEVTIEEIVVQEATPDDVVQDAVVQEDVVKKDEVDERGESVGVSHVSLKLKRNPEQTPTGEADSQFESPGAHVSKSTSQVAREVKPSPPTQVQPQATAKVESSRRFDRPQRPAHYQTETMADLLLQQGYTEAALDILHVLIKDNPLPRLQEKLVKAEAKRKRSR